MKAAFVVGGSSPDEAPDPEIPPPEAPQEAPQPEPFHGDPDNGRPHDHIRSNQ